MNRYRRQFMSWWWCLAVTSFVADVTPAHGATFATRPNVLFLFADDQSYETIAALGHTDIETPHLDRLVQRGTTFTHAYNMGSWAGAVCVASRTMLLTGRSVWNAHSIYNSTDQERQAGVLWPQLMEQAGYRTYFTGKWHVQTDVEKCFDVVRNERPGMPTTVPAAYDRPRAGTPDVWSPFDESLRGFWAGPKHWSVVTADDVIDFLQQAKGEQAPFFMYAAFNAPHDPRQAPREYVEKYPASRVTVPKNFLAEYPYKDAIGCSHSLRDEKLAPMPRTGHAVQVHRGEYYALITHLDAQIGRILDALDASGQAENTWIFYTADHGLAVGHHGLFGKQNMYDHSVRVPLLVAGPGVKANRRLHAAVYMQDVMATALELAGAKRPEHVFFHSLLPLLNGEKKDSYYESIYGGYLDLQRAINHGGWKLIAYPKASVLRLYHLTDDPEEMNDLAADPKYSESKADLFRRLIVLQKELSDRLVLENALMQR